MVFEYEVGEEGGYFDDEELIFNCGNCLISVKCSVLISFFLFQKNAFECDLF